MRIELFGTGGDGRASRRTPGTEAMRDFYYDHPNLVSNIDFHAFSQLVLTPYGYSHSEEPEDAGLLLALASQMSASILDVHGETYVPQEASDLYLASGISIDWTYGSENVYSYTIELRPAGPSTLSSFNLPIDQILPTAEEAFAAVVDIGDFTAALGMGDFNYDQNYSLADLNAIADGVVYGTSRGEFDVNGDALIDVNDVNAWLQNAGGQNLPGGNAYLPGDASLDGAVNQVDLDMWAANYAANTTDWDRGDFNTDGIVGGLDILSWQRNYGVQQALAALQVNVPEPSSLMMMSLLGLSVVSRRFRLGRFY